MAEGNPLPSTSLLSLYDFLARLLPGCTLIGGLVWARESSWSGLARDIGFEEAPATYGVFLGLGFVAGVLLTSIAGALFEVILQTVSKIFPQLANVTAERSWQRIDAIGLRSAAAASVLAKISAEVSLCQNLCVGALLVAGLSRRPLGVGAVTLVSAILLVSWFTRIVALQHRINSFDTQWQQRSSITLETDASPRAAERER